LTFSNFTSFGQVNTTEVIISTSEGNNTIWGFKNIVLFGGNVADENCSIVFESVSTSIDKHWMIADTTTTLNLNNSFTSNDFGETYTIRSNADERSPFVDAGFGLDVPSETTMTFNLTSELYFLSNVRHGRPFDFNESVFCSADNFENATNFVITNVEDNVAPIVQISSIDPTLAILNLSNVTIQWSVNDPELVFNIINVSFPNGSLLIETDQKPLILTPNDLTVTGNYTVIAFGNDTGGLFSLAIDTFEVADVDITPPVITLISPTNNTLNNTIPLNITFSVTDNFPNDIICILENSTNVFDSGAFIQSITSVLVLAQGFIALRQEFQNLELTCFDNTLLNNSATLLLNYTLDTIPPVIIPILPLNESVFVKETMSSIEISGNCTDLPVFRFNITISNSSNEIASFQSTDSVNDIISISETLDLTNLGVGNYTIQYECADPHTKNKIENYNVRKNTTNSKIKYTTPEKNIYEIIYSDVNTVNITSYGTSKSNDGSKYNFWYDTGLIKS